VVFYCYPFAQAIKKQVQSKLIAGKLPNKSKQDPLTFFPIRKLFMQHLGASGYCLIISPFGVLPLEMVDLPFLIFL